MEPNDALATAIASTQEVVDRIEPSALARPSICTGWDVRALLNHTLGMMWATAALLSDTEPRYETTPGGLPSVDIVGDDPSTAFRDAGKAVQDAAAIDGTLERVRQTPIGEVPCHVFVNLPITDVFVHGWDAARSLGLDARFDDELATQMLGFCTQAFGDNRPPPPIFGALVVVPDDAPVMDRLVAILGRDPSS